MEWRRSPPGPLGQEKTAHPMGPGTERPARPREAGVRHRRRPVNSGQGVTRKMWDSLFYSQGNMVFWLHRKRRWSHPLCIQAGPSVAAWIQKRKKKESVLVFHKAPAGPGASGSGFFLYKEAYSGGDLKGSGRLSDGAGGGTGQERCSALGSSPEAPCSGFTEKQRRKQPGRKVILDFPRMMYYNSF